MRFISAAFTVLLISTPAFAAEVKVVSLSDEGKSTYVSLNEKSGTYTYDTELGETVTAIALDPDTAAKVTHIEYAHTTSWAVGEDGPWRTIPASETVSDWKKIPVSDLKDGQITVPLDYKEPDAPLSKSTITAAQKNFKNDKDFPDPERWIKLLDQCNGHEFDPCYTYFSANKIRYTLNDGTRILATITYPGGC